MKPVAVGLLFCVLCALSCLPGAGKTATTGDDTRVAQAYEFLNSFQCDRALAALNGPYVQALNTCDYHRAARYLLLMATAFRFDDNMQCYLICCRQAETLDPQSIEAHTMTAEALGRSGHLAEAEDHLKQFTAQAKTNRYVCKALANLYALEGDVEKTYEFALKLAELAPDDARPRVLLGKLNRDDDAAQQWDTAAYTVSNPYLKQLYFWQHHLRKHPTKPDLAPLKEAAFLLPDEPSWRTSMALHLADTGDHEGAFRLMCQAVACPRLYNRAFSQLALYCAYHKKSATADATIDYAMKINPTAPDLNFVKGQVLAAEGKLPEALKYYQRTIELNPRQNVAYQALSSVWRYQNNTAAAEELGKQWLEDCPYLPDPWLFRAGLYSHRQQWQPGLADYIQARARMPFAERNKLAHKDLWLPLAYGAGTCAYKLGDKDQALQYALVFNQLKPDTSDQMMRVRPGKIAYENVQGKAKSAAAHGLLADMLYEMAQFDDCIAEYKSAIADKDDIEWHRGLLKAYMDKHDFAAASKEDLIVANHAVINDVPRAIDRVRKQLYP